jgi:mono/diheme cytochrome c family protein
VSLLRVALLTVLVSAIVAVLAGCSSTVPGGKSVTTPTPATVVGPLPQQATGNAAAGKALFISAGCGACHTFTPAATKGTIGPNLDTLAQQAKVANQGTLQQFTTASIVTPTAYIAPGYPSGVMPTTYPQTLKASQIADIVAFLVKGP